MKRIALGTLAAAAALIVAGPVRAQEQGADPAKLFEELDKNGDGKLVADEVGEDRSRFFDRLVRVGDKDENGELSKEEFVAALQQRRPRQAPEQPGRRPEGGRPGGGEFFQRLDTNGDGKLTLNEIPEQARERFKPLFERLGKEELTREEFAQAGRGRPNPGEMFRRFDTNGDGKITLAEVPEEFKDRIRPLFERLDKEELTQEDVARAFAQGGPGRPGTPGGGRGPAFFATLDENRDGRLSKDELAKAVDKFAELDANGDGSLQPEELFRPAGGDRPDGRRPEGAPGRRPGGADFVQRIFQQADANGDGKLSKDEAPDRMKENFDQIDANSDGSITLEELRSRFGGRRPGGQPESRRPRRPSSDE